MSKKAMRDFNRRIYELEKRRADNKTNNEIFKIMMVIGAFALRDTDGFGAKRIERWWERVNWWIDGINDGDLTFEDIAIELEKETGLVVKNRHRTREWKDL